MPSITKGILEHLAQKKRTVGHDDPMNGIFEIAQKEILLRFAPMTMLTAHNAMAPAQQVQYGPFIELSGVALQEKQQMCALIYAAAAGDPAMCHDFSACGGNYDVVFETYLLPMLEKKVGPRSIGVLVGR